MTNGTPEIPPQSWRLPRATVFILGLIILAGAAGLVAWRYSPQQKKVPTTPVPGSCQILEAKYCSQAEIFNWTYEGQVYKLVGFRLPPGVPLFSPIDGQVAKIKWNDPTSPFAGYRAGVKDLYDPSLTVFSFFGDLQFDNMFSLDVKKGELIGRTQDTGVKMFEGYNLVFRITRRDPESKDVARFFTPQEILKEYFPKGTQ